MKEKHVMDMKHADTIANDINRTERDMFPFLILFFRVFGRLNKKRKFVILYSSSSKISSSSMGGKSSSAT